MRTRCGVLISNDLKPAQQCAKAAKKAYSVLGRISRAFTFRDKVVWTKLYKTFVRPQLEFANSSWSPITVADKNLLESVQKKAVMQISNMPGMTYTERLEHLNLPTLEERRTRGDLIMVWQLLTHYVDIDLKIFSDFVDPEPSQHTRHSSNKLNLKINPFRTEIRKNSFSIRAAKTWNELPIEIREARTLNSFKNKYDDHKKVEKLLLKSQY